MKTIQLYIVLSVMIVMLGSCEYDNYDAPESKLEGQLVYQGTPLNLDARNVYMELWEPGWEKKNKIDVHVNQNGAFSALLFNGDYKLFIRRNSVPFMAPHNDQTNSDTILVEIRGNKKVDIDVIPYYLVKNASITNTGKTVNAAFGMEKVITDANQKDVERVTLYINKGNLVSSDMKIAEASLNGGDIADPNAILLTTEIPDLTPAQSYVYARVGIKLAGVDYLIYSEIQKIDF
jgi:hypothetical protein